MVISMPKRRSVANVTIPEWLITQRSGQKIDEYTHSRWHFFDGGKTAYIAMGGRI
jgi:hypothetical protein